MSCIHICLISDRILPNLIPLLDDPTATAVVTFAGDSSQTKQRRRFNHLVERAGLSVIKSTNAKDSFDFATLQATAQKLRKQLDRDYPDASYVVNVTAGTKPMSIALYMAFADAENCKIIYVDTQNGAVRSMNSADAAVACGDVINLPTYLAAQNFIMQTNTAEDEDEVAFMKEREHLIHSVFLKNIHKFRYLSAILNKAGANASDPKKPDFSLTQKLTNKVSNDMAPFVRKLEDYGFFTWDGNKTIEFENEIAAQFIAGGWLEEYAYWCAKTAGVKHIGLNVTGYWDKDVLNEHNGQPTNEFDLLLCYKNQLLVIECKTVNFHARFAKGQDIVNKIDTLGTRLGGLFGKTMLLSADIISDTHHETKHVASRIKSYKHTLVHGSELLNLTSKIQDWMKKCDSKYEQTSAETPPLEAS